MKPTNSLKNSRSGGNFVPGLLQRERAHAGHDARRLAPDERALFQGSVPSLLTGVSSLPVTRALNEPICPAAADDAEQITGFGRPLPRAFQFWAGRYFGTELDDIRIHDDQNAHEQADTQQADALTFGSDIVFAKGAYTPGTPTGDELIAHELTHAVQQNAPGVPPTVQRNNHGDQGIGSRPPTEPFVTMEGTGPEDGFVLFGQNRINLDSTDTRTIRGLLSQYGGEGPVTVHIHGYASREGDEQYNSNLSAHRGVAVKNVLDPLLPEGSRVIVYAHGETTEFGNLANNRRVGIDFIRQQEDPLMFNPGFVPRLHLNPDLQLNLQFSELDLYRRMLDLGVSPPSGGINPSLLDPQPTTPSSESMVTSPPVTAVPTVDFTTLAPLYSQRGVVQDARDAESAQQHFELWYRNFILLGLNPSMAEWLSNAGTGLAVGTRLSLEYPTRMETMDRQMGTEITGGSIPVDQLFRWLINRNRRNHE
jgi:outer membrane protein OmpA-like peptidoglycan-associated protein